MPRWRSDLSQKLLRMTDQQVHHSWCVAMGAGRKRRRPSRGEIDAVYQDEFRRRLLNRSSAARK